MNMAAKIDLRPLLEQMLSRKEFLEKARNLRPDDIKPVIDHDYAMRELCDQLKNRLRELIRLDNSKLTYEQWSIDWVEAVSKALATLYIAERSL